MDERGNERLLRPMSELLREPCLASANKDSSSTSSDVDALHESQHAQSSTCPINNQRPTPSNKLTSDIDNVMRQLQNTSLHESENPDSENKKEEDILDRPQSYHNHPRRTSSLGHQRVGDPIARETDIVSYAPNVPMKKEPDNTNDSTFSRHKHVEDLPFSAEHTSGSLRPLSSPIVDKALPPAPDPDPDLPFDFHRFLEQLRHRTADPVAKFLRSFLVEFGKKQWMVHEQVKIISDFLSFITGKMQQCEIWREVSDAEFDNAKEGMEKLVMNRLYAQTFSPAISPPAVASPVKNKKKVSDRGLPPGRRGQHQEDIERDEILAQKVRIYSWVSEQHLDISPVGASGRRFLALAEKELLKISSYRAPRDKVICVLNCCKVIFGLLRNTKSSDTSADSFIPLLIYVVLQASPEHLVSNIQYILRFRSQDKLGGEAGYYLSSLMGAIQFIENMDRTSLTVTDAEFEQNVEAAVSEIAERDRSHDALSASIVASDKSRANPSGNGPIDAHQRLSDSMERYSHAPSTSSTTSREVSGDAAAVGSIIRSIQKPLSSIGRMFSEDTSNRKQTHGSDFANSEDPTRRLSPSVFQPPRRSDSYSRMKGDSGRGETTNNGSAIDTDYQMDVDRTTSTRAQGVEHQDVIETLVGMFPDLDLDVIEDVVRMKDGRVGAAVDACLALNT